MIVDIHTHVFPDAIASAAVDKLRQSSHTRAFSDGTAAGLRAAMARAGVDFSVVLPVATNPRQVPHVNDASIRIQETASETGLLSFGCMHPDFPDWRGELARLAVAGVKGVKLHPPYQEADFDDPRYLRVLDRCGELGLIVMIHAGLDVGLPGHRQATPDKISRALRAAGPVTLILAHMGGWRCWDKAEELLADTGAYIDTSFSLGPMTPIGDGYYDDASGGLDRLTPERFLRLVRAFGPERVLFGTDSPWEDPAAEIRKLQSLPLSPAEQTAILGGNAKRMLGL